MAGSLPLAGYRALTRMGGPLVRLWLRRRSRQGKEDPARAPERWGHAGRPRPEGRLWWIHGASVGESLAALPLITALLEAHADLHLLVTTGTVTSAQLMAERLPPQAFHQYVPVDQPAAVRRFLDHWRPDGALWLESELWPNLLRTLKQRGVPVILVNGRLSARSAQRWQAFPRTRAALLDTFAACLAQTGDDGARLAALGAPAVTVTGNLKDAAPPPPADPQVLATLTAAVGTRPCWLALSTHADEEHQIARVHQRVATRFPDLLTLILPRHPQRGADLARALTADTGRTVPRRSETPLPTAETALFLVDTLGEVGLFARLAPIVFVGKTLAVGGGQNPLEPARLHCALLWGPAMDNFPEAAPRLRAAGAAEEVADAEALAQRLAALLQDPARVATMATAGEHCVAEGALVLPRTLAALAPWLAPEQAPTGP